MVHLLGTRTPHSNISVRAWGGWWGHPQGDVHMVAARLGCKSIVVGTGGPILALAVWTGYSHLVGGSFLAGKTALALWQVFDNQKC